MRIGRKFAKSSDQHDNFEREILNKNVTIGHLGCIRFNVNIVNFVLKCVRSNDDKSVNGCVFEGKSVWVKDLEFTICDIVMEKLV